jgi:AraC family transcriptional regulator
MSARNVKTGRRGGVKVRAFPMLVLPLLRHVTRHLDEDVSLGALAAEVRRSPFELHRAFRRVVGETTKQYTLRLRLDHAAATLVTTRASVLDVALASGFASHEVFTRAFRRRFGLSPSAYRARGLAGAKDAAALHAAVVREAGPCIGLHHLDEPRRSPMPSPTVTTRTQNPQSVLFIRRKTKASEIAKTLGEILPKVFAHAQAAGIPLAGPPYVRYVTVGRGLMTLEGGMPVAAPARGEGEIEAGELPGGLVATTTHVGPYEGLQETHAALEAWIEAGEHEAAAGGPWEVYITDPGQVPDPREWRTEVYWPLKR